MEPIDTIIKQEERSLLKEALNQLPELERLVLRMSNIEGVPLPIIAAITATPIKQVKQIASSAMGRLRKLMIADAA